jgi:hypothetical protein
VDLSLACHEVCIRGWSTPGYVLLHALVEPHVLILDAGEDASGGTSMDVSLDAARSASPRARCLGFGGGDEETAHPLSLACCNVATACCKATVLCSFHAWVI